MYKAIILFIIGALTAYGIYAADSFGVNTYNVQPGYTTVISAFTVCRDVKNTSTDPTKGVLVPLNTLPEWQAFNTNKPSIITITDVTDTTRQSGCCVTGCTTCCTTCTKACTTVN